MLKLIYFLNIFLVFGLNICHSQEALVAHIEKIGIEDGLSSYNVRSILKSSDGVMWFGTDYGLNRYDGSSIRYFTQESHGLCHDRIERISEDDQANIWLWGSDIGGERHLCIFNPLTEEVFSIGEYTEEPPAFDESNTEMFPSYQRKILFATQLEGAYHYFELANKKLNPIIQIPAHASQGPAFAIGKDSFAVMNWSFDPSYVNNIEYYYNGKLHHTENCKNTSSYVYQFNTDGQSLWSPCLDLSNSEDGYMGVSFIVDGQQTPAVEIQNNWNEFFVYNQEKIYTISENALKIYNALDAKLLVEIPIDLKLENVAGQRKISMDNEGNIWWYNNQHIYHIHLSSKFFDLGLPGHPTRGIIVLDSTQMYVAGRGSFFESADWQPWSSYNKEVLLDDFHPTGVIQDRYNPNLLWWATEYHGLIAFDISLKQHEFYPFKFNDKQTVLWKPYQDAKGDLWVGAGEGLYRLNKASRSFTLFGEGQQQAELLQRSSVFYFHTNEEGTWLCTTTGLYLVDLVTEEILQHYNSEKKDVNYIPSNRIAHLHEDADGAFWLATKGDGLIKWNPNTGDHQQFTQFNAGLSHNVLYAVYEDKQEQLWLSSNRGIMSFNKKTNFVNIYLEEDGLPHNEFNTIAHTQDEEGKIYFGSQNGSVSFQPNHFNLTQKNANLKLTRCFKENKRTKQQDLLTTELLTDNKLVLSPEDKYIQLEFALLNYKKSSSHQYSYQLVGYDQDWNYQNKNHIRINSLPYGTYELKLRAKASSSTSWINYPEEIIIHVSKPFYLQRWFITTILGLLLISLYAFYKWRTQRFINRQIELENIVQERTQEIAKQAEELKVLDKVKSNFFANISHELRTPLTLILGPLSYILDNPSAFEEQKVKEQLLVMQRNGRSLMDLIEEILDLSKLEANKVELQEEATPVKQFYERIFSIFQPQLEVQGLHGQLEIILQNESLSVLMDRKKTEKIVNNFLFNAMKFTPKGGEINFIVEENENTIDVIVRDNGKGIHPDDLPFIFDRFYQSKQGDQKIFGGTGIGLALVQEFARLMNGQAFAESMLGKGSSFHFSAPKKISTSHSGWQQTSELYLMEDTLIEIEGDFCVLVVEDNIDMRQFICQLLSSKYEILTATNGAEGIAVLEKNYDKIDIVISDVMMPEVDGLTMLSKIKTHPQWQQIPVVMLTALAAERDKLKALTIGVDDYLTKPFSVLELMVRIQNLLYNAHQRKIAIQELSDEDITDNLSNSEPLQKEWVSRVEAFILESIEKEEIPTVELLSNKLFLSIRQLQRKIKLATGLTPKQFTQVVQLQKARKLLEEGRILSVAEVAYKTGFQLPITFSRVYKKRFGKLPSSYFKS